MNEFIDPRILFQRARMRRAMQLGLADMGALTTGQSVGAGAGAGAAAGAAYGSFIPIVGTGVGATIGAAVGLASSLTGGSSHAERVKNAIRSMAPLSQTALAAGNAVTQRVNAGTLLVYPADTNWAFDPAGNWSILMWMGTGRPANAPFTQITADPPEGYVSQLATGGNTTMGIHTVIWRGNGQSPVALLMQDMQAKIKKEMEAEAARAASAAAAQQAATSAANASQASFDAALTQADIQRRSKDYDGALATLTAALPQAQSIQDGVSRIQALISQISGEKMASETATASKADAQAALDSALDSARATAKRGAFDEADAIVNEARQYARVIGGYAVTSQLNSATMYIDNLRQTAADKERAQQLAVQRAADLETLKASNAQEIASLTAATTAATTTPTISGSTELAVDPNAAALQMQLMMQQMQGSASAIGPVNPPPTRQVQPQRAKRPVRRRPVQQRQQSSVPSWVPVAAVGGLVFLAILKLRRS